MNTPRVIAAAIAVFLAVTALQTLSWEERPPAGWQPAWWQSRLWAQAGILLLAPAWLAGGAVSTIVAGHSLHTTKVVIAIACGLYTVAAYFITHLVTRWIGKQFANKQRPNQGWQL